MKQKKQLTPKRKTTAMAGKAANNAVPTTMPANRRLKRTAAIRQNALAKQIDEGCLSTAKDAPKTIAQMLRNRKMPSRAGIGRSKPAPQARTRPIQKNKENWRQRLAKSSRSSDSKSSSESSSSSSSISSSEKQSESSF